MVPWALYAAGLGVAFSLAAALAEAGLRAQGSAAGRRGARWIWTAAMIATVAVPVATGTVVGSAAPVDSGSSPMGAADVLMVLAWVVTSLAFLADMRMSEWTVRRNARSWGRERRNGVDVLVSSGFGPGVIGARSPRIVLPSWTGGAPSKLEGLIITHEEEHVRAGDTRLLLAGVVLTALVPWCLPLWWQLHRLREAIETDCDARVLARTGDPRRYAEALVTVAGRPTRNLLPMTALSPGRGELERRIRHITAGGRTRGGARGPALLLAASLLTLLPVFVPAPALPTPDTGVVWMERHPVESQPPGATVILSVEPETAPEPD